jgi:pimeloyl-ACP methyl ester carboxylesterase
LACGPATQRLDARQRALTTFDPLLTLLEHGAPGAHRFAASDVRIYSYDATDPNGYTPQATRQPLTASAQALGRELDTWHRQEPRATFDLVGHSLGGVVALMWAAGASSGELRDVHAIVTLDSPVTGYPDALFAYVHAYLAALLGPVAEALVASTATVRAVDHAPARWAHGAGQYTNAVFDLSNLRDIVVPAFVATLGGADGLIDDYGTGPDAFNHGAVLRQSKALAVTAAVVRTSDGPQLASS